MERNGLTLEEASKKRFSEIEKMRYESFTEKYVMYFGWNECRYYKGMSSVVMHGIINPCHKGKDKYCHPTWNLDVRELIDFINQMRRLEDDDAK